MKKFILFGNVYKNKKVLITGDTGFKGSWLSLWLNELGAEVYGVSNGIPTIPSNFLTSKINEIINHADIDILNFNAIHKHIENIKPDFIFHLAAQAIVKDSYNNPLDTLNVNIIGTANILESLRILNLNCNAIFITSDKCYDNVEWIWGYKETDILGGKDPYSASKGAAELIIKTYSKSYFENIDSNTKVVSARAGNVIGGGDWAKYRIIPDSVNSWSKKEILEIRSPYATRPWQHVLEPLSGYLVLGQQLFIRKNLCGESFNFGPRPENNFSVEELLKEMSKHWDDVRWNIVNEINNHKEAGLLKLNCDKALAYLNWMPNLNFEETIKFVSEWYKSYYLNDEIENMQNITKNQIASFIYSAHEKKLSWVTKK
jgi:CDP-glucose 4,6-dehydratase